MSNVCYDVGISQFLIHEPSITHRDNITMSQATDSLNQFCKSKVTMPSYNMLNSSTLLYFNTIHSARKSENFAAKGPTCVGTEDPFKNQLQATTPHTHGTQHFASQNEGLEEHKENLLRICILGRHCTMGEATAGDSCIRYGLLHFRFSSLPTVYQKQWNTVQVSGPLPPTRETMNEAPAYVRLGPALAIMAIWGVRQWMETFSL